MIAGLKKVYAFIPDQVNKPVFLGQAARPDARRQIF